MLDSLTSTCGFSHNLLVAVHDTNEAVISLKDLCHTLLLWLKLTGHTEQTRLHFLQGGVQLLEGQGWGGVGSSTMGRHVSHSSMSLTHREVCYVQCIPLWEVSLVLPQCQACSVTKVHWATWCCFESVLTHQGASEDESSASHPKRKKEDGNGGREEGEETKRG